LTRSDNLEQYFEEDVIIDEDSEDGEPPPLVYYPPGWRRDAEDRERELERQFDKDMMRPRSRQAAALNMCPELEGRIMSMLVGENSDWMEFCRSFDRPSATRVLQPSTDNVILPLTYEDEEMIMTAEDEVDIFIAIDSGAVEHVASPSDLPGSIHVQPSADGKTRNFISASGDPIKNHGKAEVSLINEDGSEVDSSFQVADVCRPLHSVSRVCDTGKEVLFTEHGGVVVPAGSLSRFLGSVKALAKYPRKGGLYVSKMRARNPKGAKKSSFTRPGAKR